MNLRSLFLLFALNLSQLALAQPPAYYALVQQADSLYKAKAYTQSAATYTEAFRVNRWLGMVDDRYNAACSFALANNVDSAFAQLNRIVMKGYYTNYNHITTDADLTRLHADTRWKPLIEQVTQNKHKAEANLNRPLMAQLDSIYAKDQSGRGQLSAVEKQYGWQSEQVTALWKRINEQDAVNLSAVKAILDQHGWLGPDVVGWPGNNTLFLVIQHADLTTQEHYLPMLREAVRQGKAQSGQLALLEDRVALRQHKRQVYGSQIGRNETTKQYYVLPLDDPDNVDKRRAAVGLPPLAEYVAQWQIKWDVEQYKKDLPALEKGQR